MSKVHAYFRFLAAYLVSRAHLALVVSGANTSMIQQCFSRTVARIRAFFLFCLCGV